MNPLDPIKHSNISDPFAGKRFPPDGVLLRLLFYGRRHGYFYAALSFVGRFWFNFWCVIAPLFTRSKIAKWLAEDGPRIVNLGGGANTFDRWLTADMDPRADIFVNVTMPLPFPEQSVDVIYLEEVIEHISRHEGSLLMAECQRALKPGGALRLTTPCLDLLAAKFDGSTTNEKKVNDIFYEHGHRHIYSKAGIRDLLERSKFKTVSESHFRDDTSAYGYFDTHAFRISISDATITQYWDAAKDN